METCLVGLEPQSPYPNDTPENIAYNEQKSYEKSFIIVNIFAKNKQFYEEYILYIQKNHHKMLCLSTKENKWFYLNGGY